MENNRLFTLIITHLHINWSS